MDGISVITSLVVLLRKNHLILLQEIISTMLILKWWMMSLERMVSLEKQTLLFLDMWAVLLFCLPNLKVRKRRRFLRDWCALTYWMRISSLATT